jgi:hypothetical protein
VRRQNCPAAIGRNVAIPVHFHRSAAFVFILIKNQSHSEKFFKLSEAP